MRNEPASAVPYPDFPVDVSGTLDQRTGEYTDGGTVNAGRTDYDFKAEGVYSPSGDSSTGIAIAGPGGISTAFVSGRRVATTDGAGR